MSAASDIRGDGSFAGSAGVLAIPVLARWQARRRWRVRPAMTAWWQGAALDRQLAEGTTPQTSAALAVRARRISTPRSRRRLANGLTGALRRAQDGTPGLTAAVRPHAQEVQAARAVIVALDLRLRAPEPVTANGIAMLRALLTDGTSALYRPTERGALGSELRAAAAALDPRRS